MTSSVVDLTCSLPSMTEFRRYSAATAAATASIELIRPRLASRGFFTSSSSDPNPNNCPPKETTDHSKHWRVVMEKPVGILTRDNIIDGYIKTLAKVVGSEEEARKKIYMVSTKYYFEFEAHLPEDVAIKIKELPGVMNVVPSNKD